MSDIGIKLDLHTLQASIDDVASAVALGMDVDAPMGVTVHVAFAEDSDEADVVYVRGYHGTRESAINELLSFAFAVWDHDDPELAPWRGSDISDEDYGKCASPARQTWVEGHTDEQILDEFFGEDWWGVDKLKIEKAHAKPFSRP